MKKKYICNFAIYLIINYQNYNVRRFICILISRLLFPLSQYVNHLHDSNSESDIYYLIFWQI